MVSGVQQGQNNKGNPSQHTLILLCLQLWHAFDLPGTPTIFADVLGLIDFPVQKAQASAGLRSCLVLLLHIDIWATGCSENDAAWRRWIN